MTESNLIEVHFDGGCRPTNPGNKYGSYEVLLDGRRIFKASRVEFGWGTNNEAEFDALIAALKFIEQDLRSGGIKSRTYSVKLYTDSMIVHNRIARRNGKSKGEAGRRMSALTQTCLSYLGQFKQHEILWNGRNANVRRFGH
jgi:ribonuclease HI